MSVDTHEASADGYELTFAVNYLAYAQLVGDLVGCSESRPRRGATRSSLLDSLHDR
jgi:hypothetical protein